MYLVKMALIYTYIKIIMCIYLLNQLCTALYFFMHTCYMVSIIHTQIHIVTYMVILGLTYGMEHKSNFCGMAIGNIMLHTYIHDPICT